MANLDMTYIEVKSCTVYLQSICITNSLKVSSCNLNLTMASKFESRKQEIEYQLHYSNSLKVSSCNLNLTMASKFESRKQEIEYQWLYC